MWGRRRQAIAGPNPIHATRRIFYAIKHMDCVDVELERLRHDSRTPLRDLKITISTHRAWFKSNPCDKQDTPSIRTSYLLSSHAPTIQVLFQVLSKYAEIRWPRSLGASESTSLWGGVALGLQTSTSLWNNFEHPKLYTLWTIPPSCLQLGGEGSVCKSQALGVFMGSINPLRSMIAYISHTDPTPDSGSSTIQLCPISLYFATTCEPHFVTTCKPRLAPLKRAAQARSYT